MVKKRSTTRKRVGMVKKRSTKMGKVMPYVDVREDGDVSKFESMVSIGPVFVLVYADWCGHCQKFKENMWDEVANSKNKAVNAAAVHYNMVNKTSMKNAKIEGYPTLFEVKPTPKANVSVPVPTPRTKEDLEKLVGTSEANTKVSPMFANSAMAVKNTLGSPDQYVPEEVESLPPNLSEDMMVTEEEKKVDFQRGGGRGETRGGSLLETLVKVSAESAHAVILAGSALELSRRFKKRKHQTKRRRSLQKKKTRKH